MTEMSGKTGDRGGGAGTVFHKEGGNQVGQGDGRFRKQPPDSWGTANSSWSDMNIELTAQGVRLGLRLGLRRIRNSTEK
ncbi:MAG: hypothetical protein RL549_1194 [Verrucomicrobiota bacterium]